MLGMAALEALLSRRFKVSVATAGQQVINRRIAGQGHNSNRVKDNRILLEMETT